MDAAQWGLEQAPEDTITLQEMDALVKEYADIRMRYEEAKAISNNFYAELGAMEAKIIQALSVNGKTKYDVDGLGSISVVQSESYKVPKDVDAKKKLFNYIKEKHGAEVLMTMTSIHSATLNSWANQEAEAGVMQIPGLDQPTVTESIRFRRK